jgi:membrane associated rhomboid family serine protease
MGLYDRDYYRERRPQFALRGPQTIVGTLILINVAVYVADGLISSTHPAGALGSLNSFLALHVEALTRPYLWWQFLTYGFAHESYPGIWHIAFNMLALFFLGPAVEARYGRKEFLRLYLVMTVVAGLAWVVVERLMGHESGLAVGASGAVTGVVILFALNFPRQTLLVMFVLPMPAWLVAVLIVMGNLYLSLHAETTRIAFAGHLGGAAFAFVYYQFRWNLTRWTPNPFSLRWFPSRPKLRLHDPDRQKRPKKEDSEMSDEVDRILEKIHREGEASLTRKERRTLENASREYQKKRQGTDDDHL